MPVEIKVPSVGDSISEVVLIEWLVTPGQRVEQDATVVQLESEKATVDVPAPVAGVLTQTLKNAGDTCTIGELLGIIDPAAAPSGGAAPAPGSNGGATTAAPAPAAPAASPGSAPSQTAPDVRVMPAAARVLAESGIPASDVSGTGPGGRVLKEDAVRAAAKPPAAPAAPPAPAAPAPAPKPAAPPAPAPTMIQTAGTGDRSIKRQAMTPVRRRIAQRLLEAQQSAALLTTFNEVDMSAVQTLRKQHVESFQQRHGVKLGFMSFFVKAVIEALREYPAINAAIEGNEIVYHNYFDIGIAIGGGKGLVVPILRNAESMSFAQIEQAIGEFAKRAQAGTLSPQDLSGGTFTISNGGVYGSMLSTPIVNPPQSGVLGMHSIQERPVVRDGQIVIRPMMYLALTYDHRIVDGREAVSCLKTIKDVIENPVRMMFDI